MRDLDETDARILRLLAEDSRRPYSEIGDAVDLSPPAVSDRVSRLREAGVIRGFTIDVDRSTLRGGVPMLLRFDLRPDRVDDAADALRDADEVEHLFTTADGDVVAFVRLDHDAVHEWVESVVGDDGVRDYEVDLVSDVDWTPSVDATGFELSCAECGNTVTSEGVTARIGGDLRQFCCPTCKARYEERYERLEDGV
ncbi:AsnC family transcriptional regulator [Halobaculum sp. P14]|uniref:AsnC family transcriptional regulator n=1 Tax=Halobaculum sp. P14 TaxID=3421638 RepID=UPI003EC0A644